MSTSTFAKSADSPRFLTGCRLPDEAERRQLEADGLVIRTARDLPASGARAVASALPVRHKNIRYLPRVAAQRLANCGAFAPTYYLKTWQEAREHGWVRPDRSVNPERVMSVGFTYPLTNGGKDAGANPGNVLWAMCRHGVATERDMPENPWDWTTYPTETVWRLALSNRCDRLLLFYRGSDADLLAIKEHLAGGELAVVSITAYVDTLESYPNGTGIDNAVIYGNGTNFIAYHALTLVGYDDTRPYNDETGPQTGAFLAVNSWGAGWGIVDPDAGEGGFVWLGYKYLKTRAGGDDYVYAATDRIAYRPTDTATIEMAYPNRAATWLSITAADGNTPVGWLQNWFPRGGGQWPFMGRFVADLTDFAAWDPLFYTIQAGNNTAEGQIAGFEVEKGDGLRLVSADAPAQSVAAGAVTLTAGILVADDDALGGIGGVVRGAGAWADYDGDGDADLALCGDATNGTHLLRNTGGYFVDSGLALPPATNGGLSWADYNLDGRPDLFLSGMTPSGYRHRLLRNAGSSGFVDSGLAFPLTRGNQSAWGDLDQDGDADLILLDPSGGAGGSARVLLNGRTAFTPTGAVVPGAEADSAYALACVDFSGDGLLDLVVGDGMNRNRGGALFELQGMQSPLHGQDGMLAWGDYDGNGTLDAVSCVFNNHYPQSGPTMQTALHRNDGEKVVIIPPQPGLPGYEHWQTNRWQLLGTQTNGFIGASKGRAAWGDFDNDGRLDVAICGAEGTSSETRGTRVYRQMPDGSFLDVGAGLPGVAEGALSWCDVDDDGDLDLLVAGGQGWREGGAPPPVATLYRNRLSDEGGSARANRAPDVPAGMVASPATGGREVVFTWNPAADDRTPAPSLGYELRVGSQPGLADVVSPAGGLALLGNYSLARVSTNGQPGVRLTAPAPGRYFWSVRTLDGSLARSDWAPEQSLAVSTGGVRTGDLNGDGRVDAADLALIRRMVAGTIPKNTALADMTADGIVNEFDEQAIAKMLLGLEYNGFVGVASATIGPAGGTLPLGTAELRVPSGAFGQPAVLEVAVSSEDRSFGTNTPPVVYEIRGVPAGFALPLTLRVPDTRGADTNGTPLLFLGQSENLLPASLGVKRKGFRGIVSSSAVGGAITFELPPGTLGMVAAQTAERRAAVRANQADDDVEFTRRYCGWDLTRWHALASENGHFDVYFPEMTMDAAYLAKRQQIIALIRTLEDAYNFFVRIGFTRLADARWVNNNRRPVWVFNMGVSQGQTNESAAASASAMDIAESLLDASRQDKQRATVHHEMFHMVQSLYGAPTVSLRTLWMDEATAVWAEYATAGPTFISDVYERNLSAPYTGAERGGYYTLAEVTGSYNATKTSVQNHGYGMAGLFRRLDMLSGTQIVAKVYENIARGLTPPVSAIASAMSPTDAAEWHHGLFVEQIMGRIYPPRGDAGFRRASIAVGNKQFRLLPGPVTAKAWDVALFGLSGCVYWTYTHMNKNPRSLDPRDMLAVKLTGTPADMAFTKLAAFAEDSKGNVTGAAWNGTYDTLKTLRCYVPNLQPLFAAYGSVETLITVNNAIDPLREIKATLLMGLVQQHSGTTNLPAHTGHHVVFDAGMANTNHFPVFNGTAALDLNLKGRVESGGNFVHVQVWQGGQVDMNLAYQATLAAPTKTIPDWPSVGLRTTLTTPGIKKYRLTIRNKTTGQPSYQATSASGQFTIGYTSENRETYAVEPVYDLRTQVYNAGGTPVSDATQVDTWSQIYFVTVERF